MNLVTAEHLVRAHDLFAASMESGASDEVKATIRERDFGIEHNAVGEFLGCGLSTRTTYAQPSQSA